MFPLLGVIFWKNWGKSSKSHRLNYQKIIVFGILPWFSLNMFQNDWKGGKPVEMWRKLMIQTMIFWWFWVAFLGIVENPMIFWWFNRWFFDDFPQFFRKMIPRPVSPNHQKIIDWIIKKSSGFQQLPGMLPKNHQTKYHYSSRPPEKLPGIILEIIIFSTCPRKVTQNHRRNHPHLISVHKSP